MADTYLDTIYAECDGIRDACIEMRSLAHAFRRTGNKQVSDELWGLTSALEQSRKAILDVVGAEERRLTLRSQADLVDTLRVAVGVACRPEEE